MAKKSPFGFIRDQFHAAAPVVNVDLKGKTVIVVGANTGLGLEATQHFARMGASKLILACRNQEKGEAAIQRLKEATGYSTAELWLVDFAQFASVRAFADRAIKDLERLDILLLSAGVASTDPHYRATVDGWETTLQVNDLSSSLLGVLLLPQMIETARRYNTSPRMVIVSSDGHYWTTIEDKLFNSPNVFDVLGSKEYCTPTVLKDRYTDSKLLNVFFTRALSNHLKDQPLIINTVNPGFCASELHRDMNNPFMWIFKKLLARSAEEGSRQLVWAALGIPEGGKGSLNQLRGAYINLSQVDEPADFVLGEDGKKRQEKLWIDLISVLERVDPRVKDIVVHYLTAP